MPPRPLYGWPARTRSTQAASGCSGILKSKMTMQVIGAALVVVKVGRGGERESLDACEADAAYGVIALQLNGLGGRRRSAE